MLPFLIKTKINYLIFQIKLNMNNYKDVLLTSEDNLKTFTNISDNISGDYILPAIYTAQRTELESTIGSQLLMKLQEMVATNTIELNDDYKYLLDNYIVDFLNYSSISELIPIISFKINNMGANITEDEKVVRMSYDEIFKLKDHYKNKADYFKYRIQKYLIANYNKFPELNDYKSVEDLKQNLYSAASVNIHLGGAKGKIIL